MVHGRKGPSRTTLAASEPASSRSNTGPKTGTTSVTITGKYFTGAISVQFGGAPAATFSVTSDTSITATAPAGAANQVVDVIVSTPGGMTPIVPADKYTYGP
jgi:hypothetical protein